MGKPSPAATSAAAPFTPESEKIRTQNIEAISSNGASGGSNWNFATKEATELSASGNSTGDSRSSAQYLMAKAAQHHHENQKTTAAGEKKQESAPGISFGTKNFKSGWDKLLVTQKTVCKKAMNLLLMLEAPQRYFASQRAKSSARKHSGIILDYGTDDERTITLQRRARERAEAEIMKKKAG